MAIAKPLDHTTTVPSAMRTQKDKSPEFDEPALVYLDFETYWDSEHSLSKMNAIEYVLHPKTEIISVAISLLLNGEREVFFLAGEANIRRFFLQLPWHMITVVAHNMEGFDALILAFRFGITPKQWMCSSAAARPYAGRCYGSTSLKNLAKFYDLEDKGSLEATNTKGKNLKDFSPAEMDAMREYNLLDTVLCREVMMANDMHAKHRAFSLPSRQAGDSTSARYMMESRLIDSTIRMLVEPKFEVDIELLKRTLDELRTRKRLALVEVGPALGIMGADNDTTIELVRAELASAPKFGRALQRLGVEIPMKVSKTTGAEIPALAKSDEGFLALQEHPDERVQAIVAARLDVKSTLLETRIETILRVAEVCDGKLPVPLKYYGADTTGRWSGTLYNLQNLPRVSGKPSDALRNCMRAPKGYKIVVADLSGIELRVNHFLWNVPSSVEMFTADPEKADLYRAFASTLYDKPIVEVTKAERQIGKLAHLGLGYGAGSATFRQVAKLMGGVDLDIDDANTIVRAWRGEYPEIVAGWRAFDRALPMMHAEADGQPYPTLLVHQGTNPIEGAAIPITTIANGLSTPVGHIYYPNLTKRRGDDGKAEWVYHPDLYPNKAAKIYAGKGVENLVQHLSRGILAEMHIAILEETGHHPALTVHDELVYVVPVYDAEAHLATVLRIMRTPPKWWPTLAVWAEGDIGNTYGEAK